MPKKNLAACQKKPNIKPPIDWEINKLSNFLLTASLPIRLCGLIIQTLLEHRKYIIRKFAVNSWRQVLACQSKMVTHNKGSFDIFIIVFFFPFINLCVTFSLQKLFLHLTYFIFMVAKFYFYYNKRNVNFQINLKMRRKNWFYI